MQILRLIKISLHLVLSLGKGTMRNFCFWFCSWFLFLFLVSLPSYIFPASSLRFCSLFIPFSDMESHSSHAAESKSSKANLARNVLIMKAEKVSMVFTSESSVQQWSLKILLALQKLSESNLIFSLENFLSNTEPWLFIEIGVAEAQCDDPCPTPLFWFSFLKELLYYSIYSFCLPTILKHIFTECPVCGHHSARWLLTHSWVMWKHPTLFGKCTSLSFL